MEPDVETSPEPAPASPVRRSPLRWAGVAALVVAVLATWLSWGLLDNAATDATAEQLPRTALGEALEVEVHPGTWHVYLEGSAAITAVTVRDGGGDDVAVDLTDAEGYVRQGAASVIVGTFEVSRGGARDYSVEVTGRPGADGEVRIAVGAEDDFAFSAVPTGLMVGAVVLDLLVAAGLVVLPRRRER